VRNLGYEEVGEIVEVGPGVEDLKPGDHVFGTWGHRTHHVATADYARERYVRDLAGYISQRDLQQLFCKSIETPDIADEYGVPFHIFYGVSNNARTFWSITNARKVIGYQPQDDSEVRFAEDIARLLKGA
jgi:hypothetical protein